MSELNIEETVVMVRPFKMRGVTYYKYREKGLRVDLNQAALTVLMSGDTILEYGNTMTLEDIAKVGKKWDLNTESE